MVQGIGVLLAAFVLTLAGLHSDVAEESVSNATVWRLGAYYVPTFSSCGWL
jgi:hypothetical protein